MEVKMGTEEMLSQSVGPPSLLLCVLSGHVYVSVGVQGACVSVGT